VAAGDVIQIDEGLTPRVISRGRNLCIQVYSKSAGRQVEDALVQNLRPLGGYLDGKSPRQLVFTVPVAAGFEAIEKRLTIALTPFPDVEWFYGNVYDPLDGVTPLNWWL
jgi:hypothetical protein